MVRFPPRERLSPGRYHVSYQAPVNPYWDDAFREMRRPSGANVLEPCNTRTTQSIEVARDHVDSDLRRHQMSELAPVRNLTMVQMDVGEA